MGDHAFYNHDVHGAYDLVDIGDLALEEGGVIRNCRLAVATQGTLNADKSNAVLVTTWYSGSSRIMQDVYAGAGRPLDPARYFLVFVNQIGNGLSTSPSNVEGAGGGSAFPLVTIGDDVVAQHRLLTRHYGIDRLALVIGGSMGAQQTYEWAVRFPDMVERAAPLAGTAKNTEHDFLYVQTLIEAITTDPGFKGGDYASSAEVEAGLRRHAMLWTVMGWSTEFFQQGRHRALEFADMPHFVEGLMFEYFKPMDPNNLIAMGRKWQRGDVSRHTGGDLGRALGRIKARTLVMPISSDMFFPPADCRREADLISGAECRVLDSIDGHFGLIGTDPGLLAQFDRNLGDLLAN